MHVPRDRESESEPVVVKHNQTRLTADIEDKIISMYARGMTQSDIVDCIMDICGFEISDATVRRITEKNHTTRLRVAGTST